MYGHATTQIVMIKEINKSKKDLPICNGLCIKLFYCKYEYDIADVVNAC
jgi:hypothetical protein